MTRHRTRDASTYKVRVRNDGQELSAEVKKALLPVVKIICIVKKGMCSSRTARWSWSTLFPLVVTGTRQGIF